MTADAQQMARGRRRCSTRIHGPGRNIFRRSHDPGLRRNGLSDYTFPLGNDEGSHAHDRRPAHFRKWNGYDRSGCAPRLNKIIAMHDGDSLRHVSIYVGDACHVISLSALIGRDMSDVDPLRIAGAHRVRRDIRLVRTEREPADAVPRSRAPVVSAHKDDQRGSVDRSRPPWSREPRPIPCLHTPSARSGMEQIPRVHRRSRSIPMAPPTPSGRTGTAPIPAGTPAGAHTCP